MLSSDHTLGLNNTLFQQYFNQIKLFPLYFMTFEKFLGIPLDWTYLFDFNVKQQIGDLEDTKAFILDVTWPETYPETAPQISLDTFFNNRM